MPISVYPISEDEVALCSSYSENGARDVWSYVIRNNQLTDGELIAEDACNIRTGLYEDTAALFFYEDVEDAGDYSYEGTLTCYVNGDCVEIAEDANYVQMVSDSDMIVQTGAEEDDAYTLVVLKKGDDEEIAEDVSTHEITEDENIFYISEDDLYYWNGKESVRIAKDVEGFVINNSASYSGFSCYRW